jgi:hypothetical protein
MTTSLLAPTSDRVRGHHPAGTLRRWLTTGVSYVIPLIAAGGLLIALGYALGGQAVRDAPRSPPASPGSSSPAGPG